MVGAEPGARWVSLAEPDAALSVVELADVVAACQASGHARVGAAFPVTAVLSTVYRSRVPPATGAALDKAPVSLAVFGPGRIRELKAVQSIAGVLVVISMTRIRQLRAGRLGLAAMGARAPHVSLPLRRREGQPAMSQP